MDLNKISAAIKGDNNLMVAFKSTAANLKFHYTNGKLIKGSTLYAYCVRVISNIE